MASYFIIVRGPLGVGKSTIAKRLAKALKAEYISIDSALEKYDLAKTDSDYTPKDFIRANKCIIPEAKTKLKQGKILVFDGNFYFRGQIKHLTQNLNARGFVFTLKAPLQVCIKRDRKRQQSYGKEAARAVYGLVSKFDWGIPIDTNKRTIKASYLSNPWRNGAEQRNSIFIVPFNRE